VGLEPLPVCGWPTFPSVLWCCWLGLLTCKTVSQISYTVLVETLNPAQSNLERIVAILSPTRLDYLQYRYPPSNTFTFSMDYLGRSDADSYTNIFINIHIMILSARFAVKAWPWLNNNIYWKLKYCASSHKIADLKKINFELITRGHYWTKFVEHIWGLLI